MHHNSAVIPEPVRAQLLALGIPSGKHTCAGLEAYFPREFNIGASGLDGEGLAKVLVHFASHGLISVPKSGAGASIRDVKPGWHFCQFYRTDEQLIDLVAPYMAEGLARGEAGLWVLPSREAMQAALARLPKLVENVDGCLKSGQLELLPHRSWYLDAAGRFKTFEEIAGALLAKQDRALAKGFKSVRAAGDAGWISGTQQSRDFIDYELKVNAAIGQTMIAAVCTFRADVAADELIAIVSAHQDALEKTPAD